MPYSLREIALQKRRRRKGITLRDIPADNRFRMEIAAGLLSIERVWNGEIKSLKSSFSGTLTQDADVDHLKEVMARAESNARRLSLQLLASLPFLVEQAEERHKSRWAAAIRVLTGEDVSPLLMSLKRVEDVRAVQDWAASLIKDFNETMRKRVSDIVLAGHVQRWSAREVGKRLANEMGIARRRADFIAADQANKLAAAFDQARQKEASVNQYRWRHSGKANPREHHKDRDGKIFSWDDPPADGHPRTQPRCGCRAQAYIPLLDEVES